MKSEYEIDPDYEADDDFIIENAEPEPPQHICTACERQCRFKRSAREYCLFEDKLYQTQKNKGFNDV